jgi:hypothetical protein
MGSKLGKVKLLFPVAAMFLFYVVQSFVFQKIYCLTSLYGPIASGASVDPTSQVCSSAMSVCRLYETENYDFRVALNGNVHTKFHSNPPSSSRVESCWQKDRQDLPFLRSSHAHRAKNAKQSDLTKLILT